MDTQPTTKYDRHDHRCKHTQKSVAVANTRKPTKHTHTHTQWIQQISMILYPKKTTTRGTKTHSNQKRNKKLNLPIFIFTRRPMLEITNNQEIFFFTVVFR